MLRRLTRNFNRLLVYITRLGIHFGGGTQLSEWRGITLKSRLFVLSALFLSAFISARPLFAHHSSASYDLEHPIELKGVVTNVEWTNPHVFIYMDVAGEKGGVEPWRVEGNSPNMLMRVGWKKEMLKAGDRLLVTGSPAKNGSKVLRLISLTLPNGQKFDGQGFK